MKVLDYVNKYRSLSFQDRTLFNTRFSIFFNLVLAVGKISISFFTSMFFIGAGIVNIFIMLAKLECYRCIKNPQRQILKNFNNIVGTLLILAGLEYGLYMGRLLYSDVSVMQYNEILGIVIALVAFIEIGVAINGIFKAYGKGHYLKNIKLINLSSALTAIALTEMALMSFAAEMDTRIIDGMFGVLVGVIIIFIGSYVIVGPRVSILGREYNEYILEDNKISTFDDEIEIKLTESKFYRNFIYKGKKEGNTIKGNIEKSKSPLRNYHIVWKIFGIVLSEILIFPYAVGALVFHLKEHKLINELDKIMKDNNYRRAS